MCEDRSIDLRLVLMSSLAAGFWTSRLTKTEEQGVRVSKTGKQNASSFKISSGQHRFDFGKISESGRAGLCVI